MPTSIGPAVDGAICAIESKYSDCGHANPYEKSVVSGVDTECAIEAEEIFANSSTALDTNVQATLTKVVIRKLLKQLFRVYPKSKL